MTNLQWRVMGMMMLAFGIGMLAWIETAIPAQSLAQPESTCPPPLIATTQEILAVEPVTSPTNLLTQTITVYLNYNDAFTITTESGTFVVTGTNLSQVPISLLFNTTHHLTVAGHVRPINQGGCIYGDYTLDTTTDVNGAPLTIVQVFTGTLSHAYLPVILKPSNPVTGSVLLENGACCVAGIPDATVEIDAAFSATSLLAPITDMRVTTLYPYAQSCPSEAQISPYLWEPFTMTKTFSYTVPHNWSTFRVSAQYRDALGNMSPVVCDDIAVEGMPPPP